MAEESLDEPTLLAELPAAHQALDQAAESLRQALWQAFGPTPVGWVNRILEGGRGFLAGAPLERSLSSVIDHHHVRLSQRSPKPPAVEQFLDYLSRLGGWARGRPGLTGGELESWLQGLEATCLEAADWLLAPEELGLARVLELLEKESDPERFLSWLEQGLEEAHRMASRLERAASRARGLTRELCLEVCETLAHLEEVFSLTIEEIVAGAELQLPADLEELRAELADQVVHLSLEAQGEGAAPCPHCGHLNELGRRHCGHCSVSLPAISGLEHRLIDLSESDSGRASEPENLVKLLEACLAFQQGGLDLESFRQPLREFQARLERTHQSLARSSKAPSEGEYLKMALEDLEEALELLLSVEVPTDRLLDRGLSLLFRGMRRLQSVVAETNL